MNLVRKWFSAKNTMLSVLIMLFVLSGVYVSERYEKWLVTDSRNKVEATLGIYKNGVEMILTRRLGLVRGLEKFVTSRDEKSVIDDFPIFAPGLYNDNEGVRNVGIARGGILSLIYPIKGNEGALGYNLLADQRPSVKSEIARMIESKETVVTEPFTLLQGGLGIAARKAIFRNNQLWGLVSVVVDVPDIIRSSGLEKGIDGLRLSLRDKNGIVFWGDKDMFKINPVISTIRFDNEYWELGAVPVPGWESSVLNSVRMFNMTMIFLMIIVLVVVNALWVRWGEYYTLNVRWGGAAESAKPALWYLLLGGVWILFSDRLVDLLVADRKLFMEISTIKGWIFVSVTAGLLYLWTSKSFGRLETLVRLLRKVQRVARLGYYVMDIKNDDWEGSEVLNELFGIDNHYKTNTEGWLEIVHPDDRGLMRDYFLKEVLDKNKAFDKEYRIVNRTNGKMAWVHGIGKLDFDFKGKPIRMVGTIQDITERKRYQEKLDKLSFDTLTQKQKLENILSDIGDAVFVTDTKKTIVMANNAMEKLFGLGRKEMTGKNIEEVMDLSYESSGKKPEDLLETVFNKKKQARSIETLILNRKGGVRISIDGVASPIMDEKHKLVGTVWVLRDVTKQRELEKMRLDFVSLASHQLRSPLTGIKWYVGLLRECAVKSSDKKAKEYIDSIEESNQKLIDLVDDLLAVGKMNESGFVEKQLENRSLKEIIKGASQIQARMYVDHNIRLEGIDLIPEGFVVEVDATQMIQVFGNILSNAARYSPDGSRVTVWAEKMNDGYQVMIKDEGLGIPESQKPRVFERFFRADNVAKKVPGTGLGLYMSKNIITSHGGNIWFESKEGTGTTFFVKLPIKQNKNG